MCVNNKSLISIFIFHQEISRFFGKEKKNWEKVRNVFVEL